MHHLRKVFSRFVSSYALFKVKERYRRSQLKLALSYRQRNLKTKGFEVFKAFYRKLRAKKTKLRFANMKFLSKFVEAWLAARSRIGKSFDRYRKYMLFRREHLLEFGFVHFALIVQGMHHYTMKIKYIKKLTLFNKLKALFKALVEHALKKQEVKRVLLSKLHLFNKMKLRLPFAIWNESLVDQRLKETADWFHVVVWPKHTL